jgi:hypothetical protein
MGSLDAAALPHSRLVIMHHASSVSGVTAACGGQDPALQRREGTDGALLFGLDVYSMSVVTEFRCVCTPFG